MDIPRTKDYQTINVTPLFCFRHIHFVSRSCQFCRDAWKFFVQRQQSVDSFFSMATAKKERKGKKRKKDATDFTAAKRKMLPHDRTCFFLNRNNKKAAFSSQLKKQHGFFKGKPSPKRAAAEAPSSVVCSIFNCKAKAKSKNEANLRWSCRKKTCSVRFIFFLTAEKKQFCLWTFSFQKLFAPCKTAKYGKRPWQGCAWRYLSSKHRKKRPLLRTAVKRGNGTHMTAVAAAEQKLGRRFCYCQLFVVAGVWVRHTKMNEHKWWLTRFFVGGFKLEVFFGGCSPHPKKRTAFWFVFRVFPFFL